MFLNLSKTQEQKTSSVISSFILLHQGIYMLQGTNIVTEMGDMTKTKWT